MATQTTGSVSLQQLSHTIKTHAARTPGGKAYRRLARGLHIVYEQHDGHCRLAVGREAPSAPSQQELGIIVKAFDVPIGTTVQPRKSSWQNPVTERRVDFNIFEMTWIEVTQCGEEASCSA